MCSIEKKIASFWTFDATSQLLPPSSPLFWCQDWSGCCCFFRGPHACAEGFFSSLLLPHPLFKKSVTKEFQEAHIKKNSRSSLTLIEMEFSVLSSWQTRCCLLSFCILLLLFLLSFVWPPLHSKKFFFFLQRGTPFLCQEKVKRNWTPGRRRRKKSSFKENPPKFLFCVFAKFQVAKVAANNMQKRGKGNRRWWSSLALRIL